MKDGITPREFQIIMAAAACAEAYGFHGELYLGRMSPMCGYADYDENSTENLLPGETWLGLPPVSLQCEYRDTTIYGTEDDIDSGYRHHLEYCPERPDDDEPWPGPQSEPVDLRAVDFSIPPGQYTAPGVPATEEALERAESNLLAFGHTITVQGGIIVPAHATGWPHIPLEVTQRRRQRH